MTYEFKISKSKEEDYQSYIQLNEKFSLYYNSEKYLHSYSFENDKLICYGYCFDIRDPEQETVDTLKKIISKNGFFEDLVFLNGQFILIYIRNEKIYFTCDATSLAPIYIKEDYSYITNNKDNKELKYYNPNLVLNLMNGELQRIEYNPEVTDFKDTIVNYLRYQYKYFLAKKITLYYKNNNYTKALLAIMKPSLYGNSIRLTQDEVNEDNKEFIESIAKDFNLEIKNEESDTNSDYVYLIRNLLFDYKKLLARKIKIQEESKDILVDSEFYKLNEVIQSAEINIITRKRNKSVYLNEKGILFDPFNVHAIIQLLIVNKDVNIIETIINNLLPSINYYNFIQNTTLKVINDELLEEIKDLKKNQITAKNEQFLMNTKLSYFRVSENLDGKIKRNEILVYPAKQDISNKEKFTITYENPGDGMILVQSYYKYKKNGHTIRVTVGEQEFSIDELYEGILFNVQSRLNISIHYRISRNSLPWQKAGTILIRQK